jgi:hypothetical protein
MSTPFEIRKLYKEETGEVPWEYWSLSARIGRMGDIIIDGDEDAETLKADIEKNGTFDIPDMDYVRWLEEKLSNLLKK